ATEQNSVGYEVQVSADGRTFRVLGFVRSETADASTPRTYQFRDTEPGKAGLHYYRLRQLDTDGKASFYGPRTVDFGRQPPAVQVYPNPFGQQLTLRLTNPGTAQPAHIRLFDAAGQAVLSRWVPLPAGATRLVVPLDDQLPAGLYLLALSYNKHTEYVRLMRE
ncbi:MAG: T9SS type A sorting domain-containing protein, partial [Hymenobacter sp.]|nr:T9SS type A sorting domain-containing protein [Hymenobacter sp.]